MPTFDALNAVNDAMIRKGRQTAVFVKPFVDGDDEIESLADGSGLLALPTGYTAVGRLTKDQGLNWTREIETSDTMSAGASQPTRRDITSDVSGLQFTMQESKRSVFELYEGQAIPTAAGTNGNVSWDKPDQPPNPYYRILALGKDGDGAEAFYFGVWLPRAQVTDRSEQGWNEENEIQYGITVTGYVDAAVGTSKRTLWKAPASKLTAMGFTSS